MSGGERRTAERVEAIVLVQFDEQGRHGVTRDVSEKGLLIATRHHFSPGDRVEVTVHAQTGPMKVTARVVRVDETPPEEPWRYRVAMELSEPLPKDVLEEGMQAAATLLGRTSVPPPSR